MNKFIIGLFIFVLYAAILRVALLYGDILPLTLGFLMGLLLGLIILGDN